MSEQPKTQEIENDQPASEELAEQELNEIAVGNGGNPIQPHGPIAPGG